MCHGSARNLKMTKLVWKSSTLKDIWKSGHISLFQGLLPNIIISANGVSWALVVFWVLSPQEGSLLRP